MNILLSYSGLVDTRINASEKDLPVLFRINLKFGEHLLFNKGNYYSVIELWKN